MANIIYSGNDPNAWLAQGIDLGAKIGNYDTQINIYDGSDAETYIALDGTSLGNLDSPTSPVRAQIERLQQLGLGGIGVGLEDSSNQNNQGRSSNREILSDVGIAPGDELFIDFNRLTNQLRVELDLFFSTERVAWQPRVAAEQMQYQLLKEIPTAAPASLTIGNKYYRVVQDWTVKTATGTGKWSGGKNVGQEYFDIISPNSFDAIIFQGVDYTVPTPSNLNPVVDVSDYLLSSIELEESQPIIIDDPFCLGGSNNLDFWDNTKFAYRILGSPWTQVNTQTDINAIDPIENNSDLGVLGNSLPLGVTGLGVGLPQGPHSNGPVVNNPKIQGNPSSVSAVDSLRLDFSTVALKAFQVEVTLSLFYAQERVELQPGTYGDYPEQMKYQLARKKGNGYVNVGREVLVTAENTGTYQPRTITNPGNPGEYTFIIESNEVFDTIIFKGANYGGGYNPRTDSTADEVSDYLVKQVCILTAYQGNGSQTLNATAAADTFTFNSIADGKDTIRRFNPNQDAIVINKVGFGLNRIDDFATVLGSTSLTAVSDYFNFNRSTGTLSVDLDGPFGPKLPVELVTLTGNPVPDLINLFFS